MDVFVDDWKALKEDDGGYGGKADTHLKEYQSFTDLHYSKEKTISNINWHPTINGEGHGSHDTSRYPDIPIPYDIICSHDIIRYRMLVCRCNRLQVQVFHCQVHRPTRPVGATATCTRL